MIGDSVSRRGVVWSTSRKETFINVVLLVVGMDVVRGRQMTIYLPTATTTVSHVFDLAQAFCTNGP